jgi:cysteine-rich repeat protein
MMRTRLSAIGFVAVLAASPAFAIFHEIKVKEVFAGSAAHPNAQYVLLQAYTANQNAVMGHSVLTFDAAGAPTGPFTFVGNVGNPADQMTIFVATAEAAAIFNITADLTMTAVLDPAGGKVCWEGSTPDDCVSWGNYSGSTTGVGTPYNANGGLLPGYAAQRRLDICLNAEELDACDDTDESAADWITVVPQPIKNNGTPGQTPPSTCGNNTIEGLEGCDDGDTDSGDGCSAICRVEPAPLAPSYANLDVLATADSDGNGVFEPGETVNFGPAWVNGGGGDVTLTGQVFSFTGTSGSYFIDDGGGSYGVISPLDTKNCDTTPDCYLLRVPAQTRPSQHWDSSIDEILSNEGVQTWVLHLGDSFPDVPRAHQFYAFIENLFHNGVTGGCAGGGYCPANPVTRAQMAVFLLKAALGSTYVPPDCTGTVFADVPCTGGIFDPWIEDLAARGVTGGCGGGNYCPGNSVTRAQMAVFLLKMLESSAYDPPDCAGIFDDVTCTPGTGFSDWIEELFNRQITGGCSVAPPLYCPDNANNRGQMAVFLVKTFSLLLYGFPPPVF